MSKLLHNERVDEVSKYYDSAKDLDLVITILFWASAFLSLLVLCSYEGLSPIQEVIKVIYIVLVVCYFLGNVLLTLYLIPLAERMRRKQLLSNALATPLIQDKTHLYYNNELSPSITRLGANIMENSLFSKEIASGMLKSIRLRTFGYALVLIFLFTIREISLDLLLTITQIIFSGSIIVRWLQLEFLRFRHEQTFEALYNLFLSGHCQSPKSVAVILDAFAQYETTKAISGVILSTKIFNKINNDLTLKWENICAELKINNEMLSVE